MKKQYSQPHVELNLTSCDVVRCSGVDNDYSWNNAPWSNKGGELQ